MSQKPSKLSVTFLSAADRTRRRRELIIIAAIIVVVTLLTLAENRVIHFGADIPVSNTILMFVFININLILLILMIFLVFRNVVKLLYDRRRKVMGAKLRTRLVITFVSLTLLPTIVLFFFAISFITTSIEFWFNVPVEQALNNSLKVGQRLYGYVETNNRFYLERVAYQIEKKNLLKPEKQKNLERYIQIVQRAFNLDGVEVYATNATRLTQAWKEGMTHRYLDHIAAGDLQKVPAGKKVRSITTTVIDGELLRTIATVPFDASRETAKGFVALSNMIPPNLAEDMESISRGYEQYQQIKLLKRPIKVSYYITLSIVGLLVVFCAVWFGFYLAKSISIPIMELAQGTRKVAEGNLDVSIPPVADDEMGSLVDSFNKMTRDLKGNREQLEQSASQLKDQNVEIEKRRQYMEIVLKNVSAGVITLDADGLVNTVNTSAEKMLHIKAGDILNRSYKSLLSGRYLHLADEILEELNASQKDAVELPLRATIEGRPRSFMVHVNELKDEAGDHMGMVMVFDDLTELEKAQRMAAWREVARRIAHEVKNPLTPISLSAQRLKRKYAEQVADPIFDDCTKTIIDHVDLIRNLVNEFSAFARFPTATLRTCELLPIIEETVALYREGLQDVVFKIELADEIPALNLDRQQIKQALINLIDNGVAAIKENGQIAIHVSHDAILNQVRIEVIDDGPGISDEDKTRLFEPNFSTKKSGMGLGLTIVSTIITDHHGMIRVLDNQPRGAKFVIELPV